MKAPNRTRIGHALVAGFAFLAIALGNSAAVRADLVADFVGPGASNDYTYTGGTTQSTLQNTAFPGTLAGDVTFGSGFFSPVGPYAAAITFSATSSTAASGNTQTGWSGSYTIFNETGGTVGGVANGAAFLTVTFSNSTLLVSGGAASLTGSATITAFLGGPITQPENMSLSLSGLVPTNPGLGSFGFNNFTGSDVNTTSATIVAPEPSTMAIAGLGALGLIGYGIRRRRGA
jgi:hypothetical protein